jgi:hypothetical protein
MRSFKSKRGSVLLVAMIFALSTAIFLGSYMSLALQSLKLSDRSFYSNAAMNFVDTGVDQAMWAMNNSTWTGFSTLSTNQYQGTFPSSSTYYNLSGGVKGQVKVWVNNNVTPAQAVAKAIITLNDGSQIIKEAEVYMTSTSYFKNGLVAKNTITLDGNATVDGWNSDPSGTYTPYSAAAVDVNGTANGKVGSTDVALSSVSGNGNAAIYGYAAVGGSASGDVSGLNTVGKYGTTGINPSYVTYDFTTSFPDSTTPTGDTYTDPSTLAKTTVAFDNTASDAGYNTNTIGAITTDTTLPVNAATDKSITINGVTTYYYYTPTANLNSNAVLTVAPGYNVVIMTTASSGTTVGTGGGSGGINIPGAVAAVPATTTTTTTTHGHTTTTTTTTTPAIPATAASSLTIYTAGDVSISGQGVMNGGTTAGSANQPVNFQLYGTRSAAAAGTSNYQSISVSGNGIFSGVVYAPNATISGSGGGNSGGIFGAMVGNSVSITGGESFHFDQSLANFGGSGLYSVSKWRELYTLSDRSTYATQLNF